MLSLKNRKQVWNEPIPLVVLALATIALYLSPLYIWGQDLNILIYDNLDSNVVWYKILAESGKIFAPNDAIIPNMMSGLPRLSYGSEFDLLLWFYYFLEPFHAYVLNETIIHFFAFFSMYILLRRYFIEEDTPYRYMIIVAVSLTFALIPFWPSGGLTVASQPLVLYAFLNIYHRRDNGYDWLILVLIPFYSSFIMAYFFFLLLGGFYWFYDAVKRRSVHWRLFAALTLMTTMYLLTNYRLVDAFVFDNGFVSHRTEFDFRHFDVQGVWKKFLEFFFEGNHHSNAVAYPLLLTLSSLAMLLSVMGRGRMSNNMLTFLFVSLLGLAYFLDRQAEIFIIGAWVVFWVLVMLYRLYYRRLSSLEMVATALIGVALLGAISYSEVIDTILKGTLFELFSLARFFMLTAFLWYLLTALSFDRLIRHGVKVVAICLFVFLQLTLQIPAATFQLHRPNMPTYKSYYAQDAFRQLMEVIGEEASTYRVVSVGIEPSVSLYNGMYTVDGYATNYPLSYKHRFHVLLAKFLQDRPADRRIYERWGSKCYLFGPYSFEPSRYDATMTIERFPYMAQEIRDFGADFIVSVYKIANAQAAKLHLMKVVKANEGYWKFYLYRLGGEKQLSTKERSAIPAGD